MDRLSWSAVGIAAAFVFLAWKGPTLPVLARGGVPPHPKTPPAEPAIGQATVTKPYVKIYDAPSETSGHMISTAPKGWIVSVLKKDIPPAEGTIDNESWMRVDAGYIKGFIIARQADGTANVADGAVILSS